MALPEKDLENAKKPLEKAYTLPTAAYTDAQVYVDECERVFSRDWICVARQEQLPNVGDFVTFEVASQPILVARDRSGALHAMSSICRHRAMPVASGCGNATRFVCPYHHWTYELDGQLRSAPMMDGVEGFSVERERLPEVQLEVWQGFVFVNLDLSAPALTPQLANLVPHIANYDFDTLSVASTIEFDSPWNWKILTENFMEAYHHIGPHLRTFEPVYPARMSEVPDNDGAPWTLLRMPAREDAHSEEGLPARAGLSAQEQYQLLAINVFPTLLFAATSFGGAWYQLEPSGHDRMHLKIHALLPQEMIPHLNDEMRAGIDEQLRVVHLEDISVNEGPWKGLHGRLTKPGRLSLFEKAIWQQNQLWLDRML